jgi:outer membrane murein-binding lipoprotein Lpp
MKKGLFVFLAAAALVATSCKENKVEEVAPAVEEVAPAVEEAAPAVDTTAAAAPAADTTTAQ